MNNRIKRPKSIRAFFVNAKMLMKYVILLFSLLWQIPLLWAIQQFIKQKIGNRKIRGKGLFAK